MSLPAYLSTAASTQQGSLKIFGDMMSQPTRAVLMFCALNKIQYTFVPCRVAKLEHKSEDNLKRHPFGQIPNIDDGGFVVFESHAILRYLAQKYKTADNWYPSDLYARTRVDQYLDWHHQNTRTMSRLSFAKAFAKNLGVKVSESDIEQYSKQTHVALRNINNTWLAHNKYLGGDKISIADLSAVCEIMQLRVIKYDFSKYPNVAAWINRIEVLPEFVQAHEVLNKVSAKL